MAETYSKLTILNVDETINDIVQAFIAESEVDSIVEIEDGLEVFAAEEIYQDIITRLKSLPILSQLEYSISEHEHKNWNDQWESKFDPIRINGLLVRATFHEEDPSAEEEIVIAPKMAFGTGHHATTYMMLERMQSLKIEGQTVLDYGCGTGILAVYAAKKGAKEIDGIDIQPEAEDNFVEHIEINGLQASNMNFMLGTLALVQGKKYDLILANINRAILLEKAKELRELCHEGTQLLLSGILENDRELVADHYNEAGFKLTLTNQREDWMLLQFVKNS